MLSGFSSVRLYATLWTAAFKAPLSMGFSRQKTRVCFCALLQGIFPTQGLNLSLSRLSELAGRFFTTSAIWEALVKKDNKKTVSLEKYFENIFCSGMAVGAPGALQNVKYVVTYWYS